jgi:hypothetical protein
LLRFVRQTPARIRTVEALQAAVQQAEASVTAAVVASATPAEAETELLGTLVGRLDAAPFAQGSANDLSRAAVPLEGVSFVKSVVAGTRGHPSGLCLGGQYGGWADKLLTLDMADPAQPRILRRTSNFGYAQSLHCCGDLLLALTGGNYYGPNELIAFDVAASGPPVRRGRLTLGETGGSVPAVICLGSSSGGYVLAAVRAPQNRGRRGGQGGAGTGGRPPRS